jgi:hypothetical protein
MEQILKVASVVGARGENSGRVDVCSVDLKDYVGKDVIVKVYVK